MCQLRLHYGCDGEIDSMRSNHKPVTYAIPSSGWGLCPFHTLKIVSETTICMIESEVQEGNGKTLHCKGGVTDTC